MTDTEKAALEQRIDELCEQVERLRTENADLISRNIRTENKCDQLQTENERLNAEQAHWELGNCPSCPNVVSLQEALEQNAKLHEYIINLEQANIVLDSDNTELRNDMRDMQMFINENAKLRSLCVEVAGILFNLEADRCGLCDRDDINHPCPAHTAKGGECLYKSELRKLGIKVPE